MIIDKYTVNFSMVYLEALRVAKEDGLEWTKKALYIPSPENLDFII
jgi:hypothetical protein